MSGTYTIKQGDCLSSIAKAFGFSDWKTIYNDPNNGDFRAHRPNPNIIYAGDTLYIPDRNNRDEHAPSDKKHTYVMKSPKTWLRIVVRDGQQAPAANCRYLLEIDGAPTPQRTTGSDGLIEEQIPADAEAGLLTVWFADDAVTGHTWSLKLGHLDPVQTMTGIQARLSNLGYPCGDVDGIIGPLTRAAVRSFQEDNGLVVDGIPGPMTQGELRNLHGC